MLIVNASKTGDSTICLWVGMFKNNVVTSSLCHVERVWLTSGIDAYQTNYIVPMSEQNLSNQRNTISTTSCHAVVNFEVNIAHKNDTKHVSKLS